MNDTWQPCAESPYSWEREALDFVRERLPAFGGWCAWSNFEFTDDLGNIRPVDLLVFSPQGVFLIDIKTWRGTITGDGTYWNREYDGKRFTCDNPRQLASAKAKALKELLSRQRAYQNGKIPFPGIESLVFLADELVRFEVAGPGRAGICLRDRDDRPGIMAALQRRECPGLDSRGSGPADSAEFQAFQAAFAQAGLQPARHSRTLADYRLVKPIAEGPYWQDWLGEHVSLANNRRRVRIYSAGNSQGREQRELLERAARREFQLLESLSHPGIIRSYALHQHELGPAILLDYPENALRLDHFLYQRGETLSETTRLHLMQRITEAVEFAHRKQVVHRALSPHSILVVNPADPRPGIRILNWQAGSRSGSTSVGHTISATSHLDALVDDAAMAFLAPEVLADTDGSQQLDVFSLGALAYYIFSGQAPAENHAALIHRLQNNQSLQITAVLNGVRGPLVDLICHSTQGDLDKRMTGVDKFREGIDRISQELATPDDEYQGNPAEAPSRAILPGGYTVERRLGQGSSAVAYLVDKQGAWLILKLASSPQHNARLNGEYRVLKKLAELPGLVQARECVQIGAHTAIELEPVFVDTEASTIETLGHRLARDGALHLDLLERFSDDLLQILCALEASGTTHRDIKPENIAVGKGAGRRLHLTLFDFSLADTPARNISAGTRRYLDPMLSLQQRMVYDTAAERYAVAVTLYQMAAGLGCFPVWGDGQTDPTLLTGVTEATISPELFESSLREGLVPFFKKAFQRDIAHRHHHAPEMLQHWQECLSGRGTSGFFTGDYGTEAELSPLLEQARLETAVHELGFSSRATNALDRADILKVRDLLAFPVFRLQRLPGIGSKTRKEINNASRALRGRLGSPPPLASPPRAGKGRELNPDTCTLEEAIDSLVQKVPVNSRQAARLFLALDDPHNPWPLQASIARQLGVSSGRVAQIVVDLRKRWQDHPVLIQVANQVAELLQSDKQGGVMTLDELAEAISAQRGALMEPARALPLARALGRAAMEVETTGMDPRFIGRRDDARVVLATSEELAKLAFRLGRKADELALEDPLLNPQRAAEMLRGLKGDWSSMGLLHDGRLLRLAAAASGGAALSTRQELYPRGMAGVRALRLAQGAWLGTRHPSAGQIRERVASRYPAAESLPDRPQLDDLLREAGIALTWDESANQGQGGYMGPRGALSLSSASSSVGRWSTRQTGTPSRTLAPGLETALHFEDRLSRSRRQPNFLTLLVEPRGYGKARAALVQRFQAEIIDLEGFFLAALRHTATALGVEWELVLRADSHRLPQEWMNLMALVRRAAPDFEERLMAACRQAAPRGPDQTDKALLLVQPGLLARYGLMDQLDKLVDQAGRRGGLPAVWLLLAGDRALIDGQAVPLIHAGLQVRVPLEWLENRHRAAHQPTDCHKTGELS